MVKEEVLAMVLRFYASDTPTDLEKYSAVATIVFETPSIVWIKGLHGTLTRKNMRELLAWLVSSEVELVKTVRASKVLPLATYVNDTYCEIDLVKQADKIDKILARG